VTWGRPLTQIGLSAGKWCLGVQRITTKFREIRHFCQKNRCEIWHFLPWNMLGPVVIMHCNKALYCMGTLEFLTSRAPCVTIFRHNPLYRSSYYISNYVRVYRTNYHSPVKFDITRFYCMWLLSELGREDRAVGLFKGKGVTGSTPPPEMLRKFFLAV